MTSSLVLVPAADTTWKQDDRLATRTPLPLSERGTEQARSYVPILRQWDVRMVYSTPDGASAQTAGILMAELSAKHRTIPGLQDADVGLWEGLSREELHQRYPKVFKRWEEDPSSVCPPKGENLSDAGERVQQALTRIVRKNGSKTVAVVLGPIAFAIATSHLQGAPFVDVWPLADHGPVRYDLKDGSIQHGLMVASAANGPQG